MARTFSVKISSIAHATEDSEKVAQAIRNLSLHEMPVSSTINRAKGHHGNEIVTIEVALRNAKVVEGFLQDIWKGLSPLDRAEVFASLSSRVDHAGTLFLRIDKQEALKGKIRLRDKDPIKIAISFRTMPSKDDDLVDNIRRKLEKIQGGISLVSRPTPYYSGS